MQEKNPCKVEGNNFFSLWCGSISSFHVERSQCCWVNHELMFSCPFLFLYLNTYMSFNIPSCKLFPDVLNSARWKKLALRFFCDKYPISHAVLGRQFQELFLLAIWGHTTLLAFFQFPEALWSTRLCFYQLNVRINFFCIFSISFHELAEIMSFHISVP